MGKVQCNEFKLGMVVMFILAYGYLKHEKLWHQWKQVLLVRCWLRLINIIKIGIGGRQKQKYSKQLNFIMVDILFDFDENSY